MQIGGWARTCVPVKRVFSQSTTSRYKQTQQELVEWAATCLPHPRLSTEMRRRADHGGYQPQQQGPPLPPAQATHTTVAVPPMQIAEQPTESKPGKGQEMGKKFGKKLGNAAIFGAGCNDWWKHCELHILDGQHYMMDLGFSLYWRHIFT